MDNKRNNLADSSSESTDIYIAKLWFFGASLATIGDGIAAVAAGMALQQLERSSKEDSQIQMELIRQIERMQKQIDQLTYKLEKLDRKMRWTNIIEMKLMLNNSIHSKFGVDFSVYLQLDEHSYKFSMEQL